MVPLRSVLLHCQCEPSKCTDLTMPLPGWSDSLGGHKALCALASTCLPRLTFLCFTLGQLLQDHQAAWAPRPCDSSAALPPLRGLVTSYHNQWSVPLTLPDFL